jgi:hypothetical protein
MEEPMGLIRPKTGVPAEALSRRSMLELTARGAATVAVSQSLLSCAADEVAGTDDDGTNGGACVLTAALTGAYPDVWLKGARATR